MDPTSSVNLLCHLSALSRPFTLFRSENSSSCLDAIERNDGFGHLHGNNTIGDIVSLYLSNPHHSQSDSDASKCSYEKPNSARSAFHDEIKIDFSASDYVLNVYVTWYLLARQQLVIDKTVLSQHFIDFVTKRIKSLPKPCSHELHEVAAILRHIRRSICHSFCIVNHNYCRFAFVCRIHCIRQLTRRWFQ